MKRINFFLIATLGIVLGGHFFLANASDDTTRIIINNLGGSDAMGHNREDYVPYEVYLNSSTNTFEIVSYDTKPATLYLCDATGNIVRTLCIPEEGIYSMPVPSGYSHLYMMIMSSDIYLGTVY